MTPQERIDRAAEAQRLLDNAVLAEALDMMRQAVIDDLQRTSLRDQEGVFIHHHKLKTIQMFRDALAAILDRGKAALPEWERDQGLRRSGPLTRAIRRVI